MHQVLRFWHSKPFAQRPDGVCQRWVRVSLFARTATVQYARLRPALCCFGVYRMVHMYQKLRHGVAIQVTQHHNGINFWWLRVSLFARRETVPHPRMRSALRRVGFQCLDDVHQVVRFRRSKSFA